MTPEYRSITELLQLIEDPNKAALLRIYDDHKDRFENAAGSSSSHQAWPGGYADHVAEAMNIVSGLFDTLNAARPLSFTKSDALLVVFLHDLEKPFRYDYDKDGALRANRQLDTKQSKAVKRSELLNDYNIKLTPEQANAMKYIEGVRDNVYTPGQRTMGELAALCHCADIISARLWYNYPLAAGQDSWTGARRINSKTDDITLKPEAYS